MHQKEMLAPQSADVKKQEIYPACPNSHAFGYKHEPAIFNYLILEICVRMTGTKTED